MKKRNDRFILIAGPCVIEDAGATLDIACALKEACSRLSVEFVFKASFDKANRTSLSSFRGPGLREGLKVLRAVKQKAQVKVLSDIHTPEQAALAAEVVDVIQVPAFLCRQTDILIAAAKTKKQVNIKKGQFLSPSDMKYVIEKIRMSGNSRIWLTERGSCFGYNNLVVDFRSFPLMKEFGYPVIYDVTHSLQRPSAARGVSGGDRQFVAPLARAAVACGVDGLFMEVHPHPSSALSDKHTSYPLRKVKALLTELMKIREATL
jgi:2-dehydro-3-deoxyphosphooctonate aldolase (KDO 8-P synthase)